MENHFTQSFLNAPSIQSTKNMDPEPRPRTLSQNQALSFSEAQQQNMRPQDHYNITASEFNSLVYQIKGDILIGTSISQLMRAKLRTWIYEEAARLRLARRVCVSALTLIDLFFSKGGLVEIDQFHSIGIACLLLANKLNDNAPIRIDTGVFPMAELVSWERAVCWRLGFRLNPITYVQVMNDLLDAWAKFSKLHKLWSYEGYGETSGLRFDGNIFFQLLDFIHLNLKCYEFPKGVIELELFKIIIERDYNKVEPEPLSIEDQVLINFWNNPQESSLAHQSFQNIFQNFQLFIHIMHPWVNLIQLAKRNEAEEWIRLLLGSNVELTVRNRAQPANSCVWMQTASPSWFQTMKQILRPRRVSNCRKGSSDTTD